jgi:hypothetical protein
VDATPLGNSEFNNDPESKTENRGSFDLLTAVLHELGHVLGLSDVEHQSFDDDLMFAWLSAEARRTPSPQAVDHVFAELGII